MNWMSFTWGLMTWFASLQHIIRQRKGRLRLTGQNDLEIYVSIYLMTVRPKCMYRVADKYIEYGRCLIVDSQIGLLGRGRRTLVCAIITFYVCVDDSRSPILIWNKGPPSALIQWLDNNSKGNCLKCTEEIHVPPPMIQLLRNMVDSP